jgi:NADPH:quinone reductase-like Zn-dependent oxidoreductase
MLYGVASVTRPGRRSLLRAGWQLLQAPRFSPMSLMNDNRAVFGLNMGRLFDEQELIQSGLDELARLIEAEAIAPHIDGVLPFSRAAEAHERIERRQNIGKVVLVPDRPDFRHMRPGRASRRLGSCMQW